MGDPPHASTRDPGPVVEKLDAAASTPVKNADPPPARFLSLWRFATPLDVALTVISVLCGLAHGVVMPLFSVLFGQIINSLNADQLEKNIQALCLQLMGVSIAAGVSAYFQFSLANVTAVRQVRAMRRAYVAALLRQDMAWYDSNPPGDLAARLVEDSVAIEDGMGSKFSLLSQSFSTFIAGITVAFSLSWKMSLVLLGFLPLLGGAMALISSLMLGAQKKGTDAYAEAGEVATEALSNVRTVAAFGGEAAVANRYEAALRSAEKESVKKSTLTGVTVGTFLLVMFVVYGVCLLWGAQLVLWDRAGNDACYIPTTSGCFVGGTVMQVLFALIMGAGALGQCAPAVTALTAALSAAGRAWALLDRVPSIDSAAPPSSAPAAAAPAPITAGRIEFRNVSFAYPARPGVNVLKDFNLVVEAGERLALVGPSGCGKSTLVALIQRWYDVDAGAVLIDGVDVRHMAVQELRRAQALVSQESLLLTGTAARNIELGALPPTSGGGGGGVEVVVAAAGGSAAVRAAAAAANATAFIDALPGGFDTALTNNSLSGGQRQRICIARALMRGGAPILLLDEATSALDSASERRVQGALDGLLAAAGGARRTTITIAHRLSTIDGADRVVVLRDGKIVEAGAPTALMAIEGSVFRSMREAQAVGHEDGAAGATASALAEDEEAPTTAAAAAAVAAAAASVAASAFAATPKPAADGKAKDEGSGEAAAALIAGEPPAPPVKFLRVARINAPEWPYALFGLFCCAVAGLTMPAFSLILSKFISIYFDPDDAALWRNAIFYMGMFFLIAGANFLASIGQQFAFGVMGARLVRRVRAAAFSSLLRFEVAWHDTHSAGSVAAALGADAALLAAATGPSLALQLQTGIGLIAGLAIAFSASWRITLVVLAIAPLIAVGGAIQIKMMTGGLEQSKKAFEECGAVATEALSAPRTVAAYGLQGATLAAFEAALEKPLKANMRAAWSSGIGMCIMATMMIGAYAIIFGIGSIFIRQGVLTFPDLLTAMFGVMFAAMGAGNSGGLAVDAKKASLATRSLFALIDRKPLIGDGGAAPAAPTARARGELALSHVTLAYPGRVGALPALSDVSLTVPAGTFVALVGASGSGKSSIVSLLLRFYEPTAGEVTLDGAPLQTLPLAWARAQMAWVQQEPSLFNSSIAYNIGFPAEAPPQKGGGAEKAPAPPREPLRRAAQASGAHGFVSALPSGYDTQCGTRGTQLSGGQKQRVCIARALLRDAPVLLLDEATSALDSESEAQVQAAVDALIDAKAAGGGGTVLVIAHRLSTVKRADLVVVLEKGRIAEQGTWAQLSEKKGGAFAAMLKLQGLA